MLSFRYGIMIVKGTHISKKVKKTLKKYGREQSIGDGKAGKKLDSLWR